MSLSDFVYNVRQSARTLGKSPGLLAFAAGALALGIAAPTVMFTIANGVLRDLPVPEGDRLIHVATRNARNNQNNNQLRMHELLAIKEQQRTLTDIAA